MSLTVNQLTYQHLNREALFSNISFSLSKGEKAALIGNNGCGKSTLLRIIMKEAEAFNGSVVHTGNLYYIPQHYGQYNDLTISQALKVDKKLLALKAILHGEMDEIHLTNLEDDWEIEEKVNRGLKFWGMEHFNPHHPISKLSGGEKTKIFLAGIQIHNPDVILMDEPTNHLDREGRKLLYNFVETTKASLLIVSHDRELLNLLPYTYELTTNGIKAYGGNYEFYKDEKNKKVNALQNQLEEKEKEMRLARKIARETLERQQKHSVRGEKRSLQKGVPRIMLNSLKDKSERSTSKLKEVHGEKQQIISGSLADIRKEIPDISRMKVDFNSSNLHVGKILIDIQDVKYAYSENYLWKNSISYKIESGDRIAIEGINGSGKTTFLKLITGELVPREGNIKRADSLNYIRIDQEYSMIRNDFTVQEQAFSYNNRLLPEHEIKTILNRFLFSKNSWEKSCSALSGGEKMRLSLCCLMISNNQPDLFILDEPTNNLDIQNIEILTATVRDYQGTLLVISHDEYFKKEIGISKSFYIE